MKFLASICLAVLLILAASPTQALESLVLYDDFTSKHIDPHKWSGQDFGRGTEAVRKIQDHRLRMFFRTFGETASDRDSRFSVLRLGVLNPAAVTAIQATVTVRDFKVTGCPTNAQPSFVFARVFGFFFHAGTPTPGDSTNDVLAMTRLQRRSDSTDPPGTLRALGVVLECTDPACNGVKGLGFVDLGLVSRHQPATLLLQWDKEAHRFIFKLDANTGVVNYFVTDAAPPSFQVKSLEVNGDIANCTATPRPAGSMDALFDNVFVNASAAVPTTTPRDEDLEPQD